MLQSHLMSYRHSLLLHKEDAPFGLVLKIIVFLVPAALFGTGIYLLATGDTEGAVAVLVEVPIFAVIFLAVFPRRYEVYEDHLRIVLGGPLGMNIGFDNIERIDVTERTSMTMNFVTKLARTYVRIVRRRGLAIAITPRSNEEFVQYARQAMDDWRRTRQ